MTKRVQGPSLPWVLSALAVAACSGGETRVPQAQSLSDESIQGEVTDFLSQYRAALDALDTAAVRELYISDDRFVWVEDGAVRYQSADAILAGLMGMPQGMDISTEFADLVVAAIPPTGASLRTSFHTSITGEQGGFEFWGMITMVLERQAAGWRIVSGHTSTARERGG